jgi:hypothetical protein
LLKKHKVITVNKQKRKVARKTIGSAEEHKDNTSGLKCKDWSMSNPLPSNLLTD